MTPEPDSYDKTVDQQAFRIEPISLAGLNTAPYYDEADQYSMDGIECNPIQANLIQQVQALSRQLDEEHEKLLGQQRINQRLLALTHFEQESGNSLDPELTANHLARTLGMMVRCDFICIFTYVSSERRYKIVAKHGSLAHCIPAGYQPDRNSPVVYQALQSGCIATNGDPPQAGQPLFIGEQSFPSYLAAPLVQDGSTRGLILVANSNAPFFAPEDIPVMEAASLHLQNAWNAIQRNETLTEFVQTVTMLSVIQEEASLLEMIASIARRSLNAKYALAATFRQAEWLMRGSGQAPEILASLHNGGSSFLETALQSPYTFRMNDLRRDARSAVIHLDSPDLATLLACPIRMNGVAIGILLVFGKNGGMGFRDMDVFLAERLTEHAAVNLESCYLNQEMRANLRTTQLLYDLSQSIAQAQSLVDAARAIALNAFRLMPARHCGLVLFSPEGQIVAKVIFPSYDLSITHPESLIRQAVSSRQTIFMAESETVTKTAIPIQTMQRCYGALWMEFNENQEENRHRSDEIQILVNQAAVALERQILLEETQNQKDDITRAYEDLLHILTKALDTRDESTEEHSERVTRLAMKLGSEMGLTGREMQNLKLGSLLHDIGKIGVPDHVLNKPGKLDDEEWSKMRQHPVKGAKLIEEVESLQNALPVILHHQERWDGSGYPDQMRGEQIPLLARIFAVVDVFDALTSNRPYRSALPADEAIQYLEKQAGILFDPEVVHRFTEMVRHGTAPVNTRTLGTGPLLDQ